MRMVCERGSSTATMRAAPTLRRKPVEGGRDRRRVMRKVVVHAHAAHLAAQLHAARDALEVPQRGARARGTDAGVARGGDRRQRVLHVVRAEQRPVDTAPGDAAFEHLELREVDRRRARSTGHPQPACAREALERRPAAHRERRLQAAASAAFQTMPAAARHDAHQVVELALDRGHVGVDVGVVVLEIVQDQRCAAGSGRTWRACRRRRCRTRRPR